MDSVPASIETERSRKISALADRYVAGHIARLPEQATLYALPNAANDRLTDNSPAGLADWQAEEDTLLAELEGIDPAALRGSPDWVTYGILRETLEASRGLRIVHNELWPVNQMFGWQIELPILAQAQPVASAEDREKALVRWSSLPAYLQNEMDNLREGLRRGYSTPQRNVGLVIEQLDGLLDLPVERSPFFSPAQRSQDQAFREIWTGLVSVQIYPAIRRYRDFLEKEYAPKARQVVALAAHPDGEQAYQACLRFETTLNITAEEVYRRGEQAVSRNRARMAELGAALLGVSDPHALAGRLASDKANFFASRQEMLAFCEAAVKRAHQAIPQWFGLLPRAEVAILPVPEREEKSTSSSYRPAPEDGSRPGTYSLNLFQPEKQPRSATEVMSFHETYPGHHLQIAIARERAGSHPIARLVLNGAYVEGWARYAEALSDEMGLYQTAYARIGRLAWPARGMVVDPGIHVFGWTREQAIAYIQEAETMPPEMVASLVDRIVVLPGQLTSYDTGGLEIFALREQAEQALGSRFDIRKFHDVILEDGSITLTMLREKVDAWVREGRA